MIVRKPARVRSTVVASTAHTTGRDCIRWTDRAPLGGGRVLRRLLTEQAQFADLFDEDGPPA
jgi:hypothetical protein